MSHQDQKNAKFLLFSSLVLVVIVLIMIFAVYPRDHGGFPAVIIGLIALALFIRSIVTLRKTSQVKQEMPSNSVTPIDVATQNSVVSLSMPLPKVSRLRGVIGILTAGVGGYIVYIIILVSANDLGAVFVAYFIAALIGFVALWLINKDKALLSATTSLLTIWFTYNLLPIGLFDQTTVYVLTVIVITVAYALHRAILGFISRRFGLVFIAVAVVLGLVYMYAGTGLRLRVGNSERKHDLQEIDFQYYKPSYAPAGYVVEEPYVTGKDFSDQRYIHTSLGKYGGGSVFVYQFKQLPLYRPPVDCGPENPIDTTPDRPTPCKEIAKSTVGCTVYREITYLPVGFSGPEEQLILSNAYCNLKGTTIVIDAYDYELRNDEVVKIFDSLEPAGGRKPADAANVPRPEVQRFITIFPVPIDRIKSVSKYRSCIKPFQNGTSINDPSESELSLSHHFQLTDDLVVNLKVAAPFDSVIDDISYRADGTVDGVRLASASSSLLLNVTLSNLLADVRVGDVLDAGETFGIIAVGDDFELTLVKQTDGENQYDSLFSHLGQTIMADFDQRGLSEDSIIISKAHRDQAPCNSQSNKLADLLVLKRKLYDPKTRGYIWQ